MSLFAKIATAQGGMSRRYALGGRHLVELTSAFFSEPGENSANKDRTKPLLGFTGKLVYSNKPGDFTPGDEMTVNDGCRFLESALSRFRRGLAAAKQSKEGLEKCNEATLGLTQKENESDKEFGERIVAEAKRLSGEEQPLVGALVVFDCVTKTKLDGSGSYTTFEVRVPTEGDLKDAGLLDDDAVAAAE